MQSLYREEVGILDFTLFFCINNEGRKVKGSMEKEKNFCTLNAMKKSSISVSLLFNKFLPVSSYSDHLVCICIKTKDKNNMSWD